LMSMRTLSCMVTMISSRVFETNEGIIRTRYFLKRRRTQLKVHGKQLRMWLLKKYKGREWRRIREIYYRAAKETINNTLEIGTAIIIMRILRAIGRIWAQRSLMGGYTAGHIGGFQ